MIRQAAVALLCAVAASAVATAPTRAQGAPFVEAPPPSTFSVSATGGVFPVLHGAVDLPDGYQAIVYMWALPAPDAEARSAAGLSPCYTKCALALKAGANEPAATVPIRDGTFVAGPFALWGGDPVPPGVYTVHAAFMPPPDVDQDKAPNLLRVSLKINVQTGGP